LAHTLEEAFQFCGQEVELLKPFNLLKQPQQLLNHIVTLTSRIRREEEDEQAKRRPGDRDLQRT